MYRASVAALALICALVASFVPVLATANPDVGAEDNGLSAPEEVYLERYAAAQEQLGSGAVGANIVDDGTGQHEAYNVPDEVVEQKAEVLGTMLNPPSYEQAPALNSESSYSSEAEYSGGSYSIPESIVQCESGGDYSAVNPSSGAYGAYQVLPSTHDTVCSDLGYSPAEQDECAARIYAQSGASAWVCG